MRFSWRVRLAVLVVLAVCLLQGAKPQPAVAKLPSPAAVAGATIPKDTTIYGDVRDARNKTPETVIPNDLPPVRGAIVTLPGLHLAATTDMHGQFLVHVGAAALPVGAPYLKYAGTVTAAGFGQWSITGAPVYTDGRATHMYIELQAAPTVINYVPSEERVKPRVLKSASPDTGGGRFAAPMANSACSGFGS